MSLLDIKNIDKQKLQNLIEDRVFENKELKLPTPFGVLNLEKSIL